MSSPSRPARRWTSSWSPTRRQAYTTWLPCPTGTKARPPEPVLSHERHGAVQKQPR
uniref:Uncharacterized protein n=1 Tax=Arundo donax TaxID=35708 RepID=A0A0A9AWQ0_ARUDO